MIGCCSTAKILVACKKFLFKQSNRFCFSAREERDPNEWIFLFYDALRAHMTSDFFTLLEDKRFVVDLLSTHTSNKLQPLDESNLNSFKVALLQALMYCKKSQLNLRTRHEHNLAGIFSIIKFAYFASYTCANIRSAFQKK